MVAVIFSRSGGRNRPKTSEQIRFRAISERNMAAQGARSSDGDCHESVLDDVFERYGPIDDVEAFIDLQFKHALKGEEEMFPSYPDGTQLIGSKVEVKNVADGSLATLGSFTYFGTDTQINLDHTISLASPQEELESDAVCPYCRRVLEKDGLDDCRTFYGDNKVNRETTTSLTLQEKTSGCDGGIEMRGVYYNVICFCSCLIARLNIT